MFCILTLFPTDMISAGLNGHTPAVRSIRNILSVLMLSDDVKVNVAFKEHISSSTKLLNHPELF